MALTALRAKFPRFARSPGDSGAVLRLTPLLIVVSPNGDRSQAIARVAGMVEQQVRSANLVLSIPAPGQAVYEALHSRLTPSRRISLRGRCSAVHAASATLRIAYSRWWPGPRAGTGTATSSDRPPSRAGIGWAGSRSGAGNPARGPAGLGSRGERYRGHLPPGRERRPRQAAPSQQPADGTADESGRGELQPAHRAASVGGQHLAEAATDQPAGEPQQDRGPGRQLALPSAGRVPPPSGSGRPWC